MPGAGWQLRVAGYWSLVNSAVASGLRPVAYDQQPATSNQQPTSSQYIPQSSTNTDTT